MPLTYPRRRRPAVTPAKAGVSPGFASDSRLRGSHGGGRAAVAHPRDA